MEEVFTLYVYSEPWIGLKCPVCLYLYLHLYDTDIDIDYRLDFSKHVIDMEFY